MKNLLRYLKIAQPFVHFAIESAGMMAGEKAKKTIAAIKYADKILDAVINNTEIPDAPKELISSDKK